MRVKIEEIVGELRACEVTNNGAGMFWSSGSTQMVRVDFQSSQPSRWGGRIC